MLGELAKQGVTKSGGKVREYFASSLSIAWKEQKEMSTGETKEVFKGLLYNSEGTQMHDKYTLISHLKYMQDIIQQLDKPFILNFGGLIDLDLSSKYHEDKVYGIDTYLLSLSNLDGNEYGLENRLAAIADEDIEWSESRNEGYLYKVYGKYTFKKHVQEQAHKQFTKMIEQLELVLNEIGMEQMRKKEEREVRKAKYIIGEILHEIKATPGEGGYDGYMNMYVINTATKEQTEFVARDVFDFGTFSFPARLKEGESVFKRDNWTEEERNICNWISEFGPYKQGTRM